MVYPPPIERTRRLFLALWPDADTRQHLAALAARAAGQRGQVHTANLHLTLVFLGATNRAQLLAYQSALADVVVPRFDLVLDQYGYWPKPRILWLGCHQTPPQLLALVADLQQRLRSCGFVPERRAFQAHVTLARHFPGPTPDWPLPTPVHWPVSTFALVESRASEPGRQPYQVLQSWPG